MFNPDCPDCGVELCRPNDFQYSVICRPNDFEYVIIDSLSIPSSLLLGRNHIQDNIDNKYLIKTNFSRIINTVKNKNINPTPKIKSMFWESDEWWGNQGNTSECVGYAWSHWIEDGPIKHGGIPPIVDPRYIYVNAQKMDEWSGENYNGTSIRAGAKFLKSINKISSYYWAFDLQTLIDTVLHLGPVVCGTNWYRGMFYPNSKGFIRPTGSVVGGHAYVINGVDIDKKMFRIKNSWGQRWGKNGFAYISFNDMNKLIKENGEICIAVENNF
jgi:hypothetical protein